MSFTLTTFAAASTATGAQLDQDLQLLGAVAPMPCVVSGTNALVLAQQTTGAASSVATTIAITAYQTGMQFCGIAAATNTAATNAQVNGIGVPLAIYKPSPSGPVLLVGGEFVAGCAFTLLYDATLNVGAGGFHLISSVLAIAGATITPALVQPTTGIQLGGTAAPILTVIKNASATLAFGALLPNQTADQSFGVTGLLASDRIAWNFPQPNSAGLVITGFVVSAQTLGVRFANVTAASTITPGTITVGATAFRIV